MTSKHLFIILLALFGTISAQSDDELHIPEENDNQFPPVIHNELDVSPKEGSGAEEPIETTTVYSDLPPILEDVQLSSSTLNNENVPTTDKLICPTQCICNIEGDSDKYVVDCSDGELTELPQPLDINTTILNLQNNKLTIIPKEISELKNLKILNVNHNQIMDIAPGSISELPELTSLTLGNNRLMEYPTDLKNSFGLTKLQEFDLGGNDMRTVLKADSFTIFKALRTLTLPSATSELVEDLCTALKDSLGAVCVESCKNKQYDCPDAPDNIDDLDIVIPALIPLQTDIEKDVGFINSIVSDINNETGENSQISPETNVETTTIVASAGESIADGAFFRAAVSNALNEESKLTQTDANHVNVEQEEVNQKSTDTTSLEVPKLAATEPAKQTEAETKSTEVPPKSTIVDPKPTEVESKSTDKEPTGVKPRLAKEELTHLQGEPNSNIIDKTENATVGATTSSAKSGGVDKSIIAMVVAGMVLVVAGITIKKNWSSIRNRFSSSPRNANDRTANITNGTAPEEVPLQEKSPV
ncbi:unnamed protein product [Arctia plantaginis]|uniref:Uncharacterized protein n=1 Tax=Arctia plantaginis TaxID=874455 RepID=A0A8S1BH78_ARCPL|nr:unnamed protein product [Arctia plantaginis]